MQKSKQTNKRHKDWKARNKTEFADHVTVCIQNPKESIKKLMLEPRSEFSKFTRYKINIKKNTCVFTC